MQVMNMPAVSTAFTGMVRGEVIMTGLTIHITAITVLTLIIHTMILSTIATIPDGVLAFISEAPGIILTTLGIIIMVTAILTVIIAGEYTRTITRIRDTTTE